MPIKESETPELDDALRNLVREAKRVAREEMAEQLRAETCLTCKHGEPDEFDRIDPGYRSVACSDLCAVLEIELDIPPYSSGASVGGIETPGDFRCSLWAAKEETCAD